MTVQPVLADAEARAARDAALDLHKPYQEEAIGWACVDGACSHDRDADCPTFEVTVCAECYALAADRDPELITGAVKWPCATARALGVRA